MFIYYLPIKIGETLYYDAGGDIGFTTVQRIQLTPKRNYYYLQDGTLLEEKHINTKFFTSYANAVQYISQNQTK